MDSRGSKYSPGSFRQPFYGFTGLLKAALDSHSMDSRGTPVACYLQHFCTLNINFGTHVACYLQHFCTLSTNFGTHVACYLQHLCALNTNFGTHAVLRTAFRTHPACYLHSFYAVQHAVRYPRAPVRYPCCLLRTAFGTHSACYLHSFCIHCNMLFGTQGPRSAPEGAKLRDPYRKSRLPLWPVNNLTAKVGGTGPGWRLIQDHQHSIVWGARPPKWCLFPPITPPSSPITLSAWLFITMPIPSSGVVCVCACICPHENCAVQLGLCACLLAFVRTKIMQCKCTHARVATLN